jgi:flagellar protein FliS
MNLYEEANMYNNGINAYQQTNVLTADPKRLVIMCYSAAISNLRMASECYESGDYETKARTIQKAGDIICELINAIDFEKGGEVARNLNALYNFMHRHIVESDLKKDVRGILKIADMLEELKSAWEEIFYGSRKAETISVPGKSEQTSGLLAKIGVA